MHLSPTSKLGYLSFNTLSKELLLPRPAGLGRCTGTLCPNFILFYGNLAVFSMLFWNCMFLYKLHVLFIYSKLESMLSYLANYQW